MGLNMNSCDTKCKVVNPEYVGMLIDIHTDYFLESLSKASANYDKVTPIRFIIDGVTSDITLNDLKALLYNEVY